MSSIDTEQVLVVPTSLLHELGYFQGFTADVDRYLNTLLGPENTSYRPRAQMEQDPGFKQLIPYVILRYRDAAGEDLLFRYTRGTGQGERRLHRKCSIGIGGHISSDDAEHRDAYAEGMRRELAEEVAIAADYRDRCVGLINDDLTDVGRVHLGVVHVFELASPEVTPREEEIVEAGFVPLDALRRERDRFESWSQICLDALFGR